jgi:hypothetical protein
MALMLGITPAVLAAETDPLNDALFALNNSRADTCIVAGVPALCGSSWDYADSSNAMTFNGSVYKKVYKNVKSLSDYR